MPLPGRKNKHIRWISNNNKIYLNWGAAERIREDVVQAENKFHSLQRSYEDDPKGCMAALQAAVEFARRKLALYLNSSQSDHIIFTTGSEDSLKTVLFAHSLIPWGSEIVTTDCEFYGVYNKLLPPRYQPRVAEIWSKSTESEIVHSIANKVTPSTRLLLVSHVCYNSGLRLPIRDIIDRCKTISPSLMVLVDGAQAVGQIPVNANELGCDFYAGDAHKWLLGPDQTGFLYVRNPDHLQTLARDLSSIFSVSPELNHDKGSRSGAIAFELAALGETLDAFFETDSLSEIYNHGSFLAKRFYKGVGEKLSGFFVVAPQIPEELRSNIVCLKYTGAANPISKIEYVHDELLQQGIHIAALKHHPKVGEQWISVPPLLRFCFHYWNTTEEVDNTLKILAEIIDLSQNTTLQAAS